MPVYRSAGVDISLATVDLHDSISASVSLSKTDGPPDLRRITAVLEGEALRLGETPVIDERHDGPLRFIGASGDAPFFLVQTFDVDEPATEHTQLAQASATRSFIKDNLKPDRALIVKVDLTKFSTFRKRTQDVKIEVFYNGELTACRFISGVRSQSTWSSTAHVQIFGGRRVHRQHERPFVLAKNRDFILRKERHLDNDLQVVWQHVSQKLAEEVSKRGRNKYGDLSPVGDYLASLLRCMPPLLQSKSTRVQAKLPGIIDVVVSLGTGRKDAPTSGHHLEPARLRDQTYTPFTRTAAPAGLTAMGGFIINTPSPAIDSTGNSSARPTISSRKRPPSSSLPKPTQPQLVPRHTVNDRNAGHRRVADGLSMSTPPSKIPIPFTSHAITSVGESGLRRSNTLAGTKSSPQAWGGAEQREASPLTHQQVVQAKEQSPLISAPIALPPLREMLAGRPWTTPASALANRGVTLQPKGPIGISKSGSAEGLKLPPLKFPLPQKEYHVLDQSGPHSIRKSDSTDIPVPSVQPKTSTTTPAWLMDKLAVPSRPSKATDKTVVNSQVSLPFFESYNDPTSPSDRAVDNKRRASTALHGVPELGSQSDVSRSDEVTTTAWQPSEICRNSVFTYAEVDMCNAAAADPKGGLADGEIIRQVRKERPGEFQEGSILCGVRFVML